MVWFVFSENKKFEIWENSIHTLCFYAETIFNDWLCFCQNGSVRVSRMDKKEKCKSAKKYTNRKSYH